MWTTQLTKLITTLWMSEIINSICRSVFMSINLSAILKLCWKGNYVLCMFFISSDMTVILSVWLEIRVKRKPSPLFGWNGLSLLVCLSVRLSDYLWLCIEGSFFCLFYSRSVWKPVSLQYFSWKLANYHIFVLKILEFLMESSLFM